MINLSTNQDAVLKIVVYNWLGIDSSKFVAHIQLLRAFQTLVNVISTWFCPTQST